MSIKTFINRIENQQYSFIIGFLMLYAIILLRNILEAVFEGSQILGFTPITSHSFYMIFIHFSLFYISIFMWMVFVFILLTREQCVKVAKVLLIGMAVIIVTPIIDIIISKGSGYKLTYLTGFEQFTELHKFFDFTRELLETSWGQRVEILLVLVGGFIYVFMKTKNFIKSMSAAIITYLIIFIHGILPNTIAKIPSYFGSRILSSTTIITNGVLAIDSQNYAVIFSLSICIVGLLTLKKYRRQFPQKIFNLKDSIVPIIFLVFGIIYALFLIVPYYPFVFFSPISYLIILLAILTYFCVDTVSRSPITSTDFHILTIACIFFSVTLGQVFFMFTIIYFLTKKLLHQKWLTVIPCFCAGFSLIFQTSTLSAILPLYPTVREVRGRTLAGWSYFLNTDYTKALAEYERSYALEKNNEILKRIGQCYLNVGNLDRGIEILETITEPDYETILSLGQAYTQRRDYTQAIALYNTAIAHNSEPATFYIKIANIAARAGNEHDMIAATERALLYGSRRYEVREIMGDFYLRSGNLKKALSMYEEALRYNSRSVVALSGKGIIYYQQDDLVRAEKIFLQALKIEPNNDALYNNLGALYFTSNRLEEAEKFFKKSLKKNPNQYEAYYNLGLIYEKMGKREDALQMYDRSLQIHPLYAPAQKKIEELTE
jgi:tetratricopeptide (TPR) repeat protein